MCHAETCKVGWRGGKSSKLSMSALLTLLLLFLRFCRHALVFCFNVVRSGWMYRGSREARGINEVRRRMDVGIGNKPSFQTRLVGWMVRQRMKCRCWSRNNHTPQKSHLLWDQSQYLDPKSRREQLLKSFSSL